MALVPKRFQSLARSTYERVMKDLRYVKKDTERPWRIVRGVRPRKPQLDEEDEKKRYEYSIYCLRLLYSPTIRVIIICSDEKDVSFGGASRYRQKISRPEGGNSYHYARAQEKPKFVVKIWAACCSDPRVRFPIDVWKKEKLEDKGELKKLLDTADEENKEDCKHHQQQALIPGTPEYAHLASINLEIRRHNQAVPQRTRKGVKREKKPHQIVEWQHQPHARSERGWIDGAYHAEKVQKQLLYPVIGMDHITYVNCATISKKAARLGASHAWKYGLHYVRGSDKKEVYYCYECAVGNYKQELFVINGTSGARSHLEEKHQIDPQTGVKRNTSATKCILDQQKGAAATNNFFWKDSDDSFKELLIRVVAMWIDATGKRRSTVLGIRRVYGEHTGENLGSVVLDLLKEYDISGDQIGHFMLDNASSNDTAVEFILKGLCPWMKSQQRRHRRLRCLGHVINLCCQAFLMGRNCEKQLAKLEKHHLRGDYAKVEELWK
ncbi:hypothetical protein B0A49_12811, partial [Cryomyces minteri]